MNPETIPDSTFVWDLNRPDYTEIQTPDGAIQVVHSITIGDLMICTILMAIGIFIVLKHFFGRR